MTTRGLLATAAAGTALLTGACGGAHTGTGGPTKPKADPQAAALKFARCMRSRGIDVPDPKGGAGGAVIIGGPGSKASFRPDSPAFKAAQKACQKYLDAARPTLTPAQQAEVQQRMLEMVRCLRAHGVHIPDSAASGEGLRFGPETGIDPGSPTFQRAQKACMPKGGPGAVLQATGKGPGR